MTQPELKLPDRQPLPYLRVGLLLCPSFTLIPMACFVDCLRLAADSRDKSRQIYFSWEFIAAGSVPTVASCGLKMEPTGTLDNPDEFDCLVVCGGLTRDFENILPQTYDYLQQANELGTPIIGLCTGSFVLAQAGLLEGRRLTVAPSMLEEFLNCFELSTPAVDKAYVVDGNIMTCPGSIAAIDVASFMIEKLGNSTRARKAQDYLLYKPDKSPFEITAKPYAEALATASSLTIETVRLMEFRMDSPCSIEKLAKALNTTKTRISRSFARDIGTAPALFWRHMRLFAARELLLGRRRSIAEIAYEVGFSDSAHFCRNFKKVYRRTPEEFRRLAVSE